MAAPAPAPAARRRAASSAPTGGSRFWAHPARHPCALAPDLQGVANIEGHRATKTFAAPGDTAGHADGSDAGARDGAVARVATRQYGVVSRHQLLALGLGSEAIKRRLAAGRLHSIHRSVYAVGHRSLGAHGRWMAAVLAAGRGALLSYRSAAALWQLRPALNVRIDVSVLGRARRRRAGLLIHVTRSLSDADRTIRDRIPVTSVARTLLDLAEVISERQLTRAVEEAERMGLLDLRAVEDVCRRGWGRRGLGSLRRVAGNQYGPPPQTRSELERAFLDFCADHHLPRPVLNATFNGLEVDALWKAERLIVELDGFAFHRTRAAFERDRARDAELQLAGFRVLRITHRRLTREAKEVARGLKALLSTAQLAG